MGNVYDAWNSDKKKTEKTQRKLGIKARDIFWLKVGKNIEHEVYGKGEEFLRPVIIIRQLTSDLFVGVPTTSTKKENNDYFHTITYKNRKNTTVSSVAMLLQFKTYSKKRLLSKIGTVQKSEFDVIVKKLKRVIDPTCKD